MSVDFTTYSIVNVQLGSVQSPESERLVSNLSTYIIAGNKRLRLSGSYFVFLASCPTRVSGELCKIPDEDSDAARCDFFRATSPVHTSYVTGHAPVSTTATGALGFEELTTGDSQTEAGSSPTVPSAADQIDGTTSKSLHVLDHMHC